MQMGWATKVATHLEPTPYRRDPCGWAAARVKTHLWSKQREIAESLLDHRRVAVRSAHSIGKSFTAAVLTAWWLDVHPPGEALVVSTAPSREQVHSVLWEEIRKLHREHKLRGEVQRSDRWLLEDGTQVGIGRRPPDHNPSAFQGWHRKYVLVVMDEAGGIPAWMWDAVRTVTTSPYCRVLAIGNPDDNSSEFARVCLRDPTWHSIQVSAFDSPNLTGEWVPQKLKDLLTSREWVDDVGKAWGVNNPLYIAKVLGEFADATDGLIPLSWVQAAQRRWVDWHEARGLSLRSYRHGQLGHEIQPRGRHIFGVDVARYGEDKTAIATRQGHVLHGVERFAKLDTVSVANLVQARLETWPQSTSIVDADGIGGAVVDLLRARGQNVIAYSGGSGTRKRDKTGTQRFDRVRSAAWYHMREILDPSQDPTICLPPTTVDEKGKEDDQLAADLSAAKWPDTTGNVIQVEPKKHIIKRLGHSPDTGDAAVQAFWLGDIPRDPDRPSELKPVAYASAAGYAAGGPNVWGV